MAMRGQTQAYSLHQKGTGLQEVLLGGTLWWSLDIAQWRVFWSNLQDREPNKTLRNGDRERARRGNDGTLKNTWGVSEQAWQKERREFYIHTTLSSRVRKKLPLWSLTRDSKWKWDAQVAVLPQAVKIALTYSGSRDPWPHPSPSLVGSPWPCSSHHAELLSSGGA